VHIVPYSGHYPGPPEYEELISVVDYVRTVHGQEASERLGKGEVCLAELQGPVEMYRDWSQAKPGIKEWKTLVRASVGAQRYCYGQRVESILSMVDFDTLGRMVLPQGANLNMKTTGSLMLGKASLVLRIL
jgi:hypothetical protein